MVNLFKRADGTLSRTQQLNAILAAVGTTLVLLPDLRSSIPDWVYAVLLLGLSIVQVYLRATTTQPIQSSQELN